MRLYLVIGFILFIAWGCTQEQLSLDNSNVIQLISAMSTDELRSASQDLQRTEFAVGQDIGVFLTEDAAIPKVNYSKLIYTAGAAGALALKTGSAPYFPSTGNSVNIYAVYPQSAIDLLATPKAFSVQADQSSDAGYMNSDLMYGIPQLGNPVTRTTQPVKLSFSHLLSKININLSSISVSLTGAVVKIKNTLPTTTITPTSGTISSASGVATTITAFSATSTNTSGSAIIVPQTVAANTQFIEITLAGNSTPLVYTLPSSLTFQKGMQYTYNIYVGQNSLTVSSSITNWLNGGTSSATASVNTNTPTANCFVVNPAIGSVTVPIKNVNLFWRRGGDGSIALNMGTNMRTPNAADLAFEATDSLIVDKNYVAEVIWSSSQTAATIAITNLTVDGFTVSGLNKEGNVVVGVKRSSKNTTYLWSWHLWVTKSNLNDSTTVLPSGLIAMNKNLGALSSIPGNPLTLGLIYQWGRKDPFPGSTKTTSFNVGAVYQKTNLAATTLPLASKNSGSLLKSVSQPDYIFPIDNNVDAFQAGHLSQGYGYNRWGGAASNIDKTITQNRKSLYDPCPDGWRLPWVNNWLSAAAWNGQLTWNSTTHGWMYNTCFIPAAGCMFTNWLNDGAHGVYWSGAPDLNTTNNGGLLIFQTGGAYESNQNRSEVAPIRPVRQ